jgi:hypothetical protein
MMRCARGELTGQQRGGVCERRETGTCGMSMAGPTAVINEYQRGEGEGSEGPGGDEDMHA